MSEKIGIGIIGCGNISSQYLKYCQTFNILDVVACSDIDIEKAKARAEEYSIPKALTVEQILADPQIDIIINLTIPAAHADVSILALEHGKHVYVEKPLAIGMQDAKKVLDVANRKGLYVGCAPDTVLGAGVQTARKLIDDGWIGTPLSATAFMMGKGPESWHPDPDFFYKEGAGPLFDMGPYYITSLIQLLGPIESITATAKKGFEKRLITSKPKYGTEINVETPTHIAGNLQFLNGALATMVMSFDVFGGHHLPNIEIYGSEGTIRVPDPNYFDGYVQLSRKDNPEWKEVPHSHPYADSGRGLGVAELAHAIRDKRQNRANGKIGYHVLESMYGFLLSSKEKKVYTMESTCERPVAMDTQGLF
ncbi:Gfo/Idh/MocA family protein [Lederbergia lenta]|uniref:Dehydrogenase n=1 Tax=Lederbergia lenta TaxID=1467 RepID=A0A2X4YUM0_LEDLE|nr:Gfo/Idh/MocA family oxidoreductase [Lederbergia lenta]MEC2325401.1 Gfo/Idh/MocA family oxidoreductase [Lederbergia lenta]SQI55455.1 dehydrogenase [Lederbergia lenta]